MAKNGLGTRLFLIQEVRCRPQYHPRRLLQQIEKWMKPSVPHLVGNVGHTGSIVLTVRAEIGKYAYHHSVTAPVAASRFRDKRGSHECTSLFHTPPRFLHVFSTLNFRGRSIPRKFYSVNFFTRTFYNAEISRYTVFSYKFYSYIYIQTANAFYSLLWGSLRLAPARPN